MTSGPGCWERETSPGRFSTAAPGNRLPGGLNFAPAGYPNIKRAESPKAVLGASGIWPTRLDGLYAEVRGEHPSRASIDPIESALATARFHPAKTRDTSARYIADNDRLYLE